MIGPNFVVVSLARLRNSYVNMETLCAELEFTNVFTLCGHWGLICPRNIVDFCAIIIVYVCVCLSPIASCNMLSFCVAYIFLSCLLIYLFF